MQWQEDSVRPPVAKYYVQPEQPGTSPACVALASSSMLDNAMVHLQASMGQIDPKHDIDRYSIKLAVLMAVNEFIQGIGCLYALVSGEKAENLTPALRPFVDAILKHMPSFSINQHADGWQSD